MRVMPASDRALLPAWDAEAAISALAPTTRPPDRALRTPSGENTNKALNGVTPLVTGVVTADQTMPGSLQSEWREAVIARISPCDRVHSLGLPLLAAGQPIARLRSPNLTTP